MESIGQCSLSWYFYSIDVVEIIHGQYLKGFLLSQNRKKCTIEEVFYWEIRIIVICKQILMLQSYRVSGSKVMWSEIIWVALQSEDCCVNTGRIAYL